VYYGGRAYGKPGVYEGNAINQIGAGEGFAALGASRVQMQASILLHKGTDYIGGNIEKPWSPGTLQWAETGYYFYQGGH
jgi:hypothetical protein